MEPNSLPTEHEGESHLLPDRMKILSGSALKLIAVLSMLADHTAMALLQGTDIVVFSVGGHTVLLYDAMRSIGRPAFPIFCFLLTEGFLHTKDREKYGASLLLFALLSELPWNLLRNGTLLYAQSMNVFFTLLLGYLGLCAIEYFADRREMQLLSLAILLLISTAAGADYGCSGYGFILLVYVLRKEPIMRAIIGSCVLSSRWIAGLAFIPIAFYNGERGFIQGKAAKYAFYAIYPVHMLMLYIIKISL